jgi:hypothetical protein
MFMRKKSMRKKSMHEKLVLAAVLAFGVSVVNAADARDSDSRSRQRISCLGTSASLRMA